MDYRQLVISESHLPTKSLEELSTSRSPQELESRWRVFLRDLESYWKRMERVANELDKQPLFMDRGRADRKSDELLRYLRIARDSDQHSLSPLAATDHAKIRFSASEEGPVILRSVSVAADGSVITNSDGHLHIEFLPGAFSLLPVKSRDTTVQPPSIHLSRQISSNDPITIGELGLRYYDGIGELLIDLL